MRILLTGASGYIGRMILPVLLSKGHEVICCVRDKNRFDGLGLNLEQLELLEVDFLDENSLDKIPDDIDAAYYLIHSMSGSRGDFDRLEKLSAENFRNRMNGARVRQVIYLSGIVNEDELSRHLLSRRDVEQTLAEGRYALTTLRAGIIVGSGSASFEIIRDLVEKLPLMVAPRWLNTRAQPIAIRNVIQFLMGILLHPDTYGKSYDIGGPDVLTYREMLLQFAQVRSLRRVIRVIPVMTPRLSSYWLYFITSTSYSLAVNLVNSMKVEVVCKENDLKDLLHIDLLTYKESLSLAFDRIEPQEVLPSWRDAGFSKAVEGQAAGMVQAPKKGCFSKHFKQDVENELSVLEQIRNRREEPGWFFKNWLWNRNGYWQVLLEDSYGKRMLVYNHQQLPGEAWVELRIQDSELIQTFTFRPLGLRGRIWYSLLFPLHTLTFRRMIKGLARTESN